MAGEIRDAIRGLGELLSNIEGLRALDYPADSIGEFPAAVVLFEGRDPLDTLGGGGFAGRIKVTLLVASANTREAYDALDEFMAPQGAKSVEAAVNADNTWHKTVDDGRLLTLDNVGPRKLHGGSYVAADFHFRFIKSIPGV